MLCVTFEEGECLAILGGLPTSLEVRGVCDSTSIEWLSRRDIEDSCSNMWLSETVIPFVLSTAFETEPSTSAVGVSLRRGGVPPWRSGARAA